jgi:hypothetical protein
MNRALLAAALVLISGCGAGAGGTLPSEIEHVTLADEVPPYVVDANVALPNIPLGAMGITTNGADWFLSWQGDSSLPIGSSHNAC